MTKTAKTAKTAETAAAATAAESVLETIQNKIEVPAAAREFVARNAASAKERAETVHAVSYTHLTLPTSDLV